MLTHCSRFRPTVTTMTGFITVCLLTAIVLGAELSPTDSSNDPISNVPEKADQQRTIEDPSGTKRSEPSGSDKKESGHGNVAGAEGEVKSKEPEVKEGATNGHGDTIKTTGVVESDKNNAEDDYNDGKEERLLKLKGIIDVNNYEESYFTPHIKIRLVDTSHKPFGDPQRSGKATESYEGNVEAAVNDLKHSMLYRYEEKRIDVAELLFHTENFKKDLPSIIIIHPANSNADGIFVKNTVSALAMRNLHFSYNIITVDMRELNFFMYATSLLFYMKKQVNIMTLTEVLANFLISATKKGLLSPDKIHLVGHGYSARLAGFIGSDYYEKTNQKIASILALEPMGSPNNPHGGPITWRDAEVVHAYHSNSFPLGTMERKATADFTFNDGFVQPQCKGEKNPWLCSHKKIAEIFWYVILFGGGEKFRARRCPIYMEFYAGKCEDHPTGLLTYPIVDKKVKGNFYLKTSNDPPYGMGEDGSRVRREKETSSWVLAGEMNNVETPVSYQDMYKMILI